jgi:hypothetical protein
MIDMIPVLFESSRISFHAPPVGHSMPFEVEDTPANACRTFQVILQHTFPLTHLAKAHDHTYTFANNITFFHLVLIRKLGGGMHSSVSAFMSHLAISLFDSFKTKSSELWIPFGSKEDCMETF